MPRSTRSRQARQAPLALRLLSGPVVAGVLLLGSWIAGGLITNDFTLAMWLTAAWMGLAGLVCLWIANLFAGPARSEGEVQDSRTSGASRETRATSSTGCPRDSTWSATPPS